VRGRICLVHVKDGHVGQRRHGSHGLGPVGKGEVDWPKQFDLLRRDNYAGPLSLETHWHPKGPNASPRQSSRQPNLLRRHPSGARGQVPSPGGRGLG